MSNKINLKKYLKLTLLILIVLMIIFFVISTIEYKEYNKLINSKLNNIAINIKEKYPDITDEEIISSITNLEKQENNFFKKYGVDLDKNIIIEKDSKYFKIFITTNIVYLIGSIGIIVLLFLIYNYKKDNQLKSITKYIEEINRKNYTLDLDDMTEDELSILKNEVYKTTIMLKEQRDNSVKDKIKLKDSLSDISHQLKTPLTSILIMLDNIIDNPEMDKELKDEFINDIKREISSISFLVQAILKLSKFDSNTIEFIKQDILIKDLVEEATKSLLPVCDLRNIKIITNINNEATIIGDLKWQAEAISNILKNCIEHSEDNSKIEVYSESNRVYTLLEIKDYGSGIDDADIPHIFERFYKGKNASKNSVGIGLALAKTIIEENNGTISIESKIGEGTKFRIKYFENSKGKL